MGGRVKDTPKTPKNAITISRHSLYIFLHFTLYSYQSSLDHITIPDLRLRLVFRDGIHTLLHLRSFIH